MHTLARLGYPDEQTEATSRLVGVLQTTYFPEGWTTATWYGHGARDIQLQSDAASLRPTGADQAEGAGP